MNQFQSLIETLQTSYADNQDYPEKVVAVLASAIAINLPIPESTDGSTAKAYYNANHFHAVKQLVSEINERYILDTATALELIADIFVSRFDFVHYPRNSIEATTAIVNHLLSIEDDGVDIPTINVSDLSNLTINVYKYWNDRCEPLED